MRIRRTAAAVAVLAVLPGTLGGCGLIGGNDEEPVASEGDGGVPAEPEATEASAADPTTMDEVEVPTGPFADAAEFSQALNDVCGTVNDVYDRSSIYGTWPAGIALEYRSLAEGRATILEKYRTMEAPAESADAFATYLDALQSRVDAGFEVADANESGDQAAIDAAWEGDSTSYDAVASSREELGLETCVAYEPPTVEDTGSTPDPEATYAEPNQGVDEVVGDLVEAFATTDCARANELQFAVMTDEQCAAEKPFYSAASVVGSEQFGPIGVATLEAGEEQYPVDLYFVPDEDGDLRMAGLLRSAAGTLHPANEGNTSDQVAQAGVDAIRDNDWETFNTLLSPDNDGGLEGNPWTQSGPFDSFGSDEDGSSALVSDVRADPDATLQRLMLIRGWGQYLLTANGNQYTIGTQLAPGSQTEYWLTSYWELPEPA